MQIEIVHRADAQDAITRKRFANTIHERTASQAEIICHRFPGIDGLGLAECFQVIAAAEVLEVRICDDEVGREH